MEDKIKEAIKLLKTNNYIVIKCTKQMNEDMNSCEKSSGSKDCCGCSCSICIMCDD